MVSSTVLALAMQVLLRSGSADAVPPQVEIVAWSLIRGVDPHVALAVQAAETGGLDEPSGSRDRVISKGNYGRFQIRCKTWRQVFGHQDCDELLDRHANIRAGVAVLAYVQAIFNGGRLAGVPTWVGHYNEGNVVTPGGNGERFTRAVLGYMRRAQLLASRMYGSYRGW